MYVNDSVPREQIIDYKKLFREESDKKEDNTKLIYQQNLNDFNGIFLNTELLITYRIHEQKDSLFAENAIEKILLKPIVGKTDQFNSSKLLLGDFIFERDENGKVKELYIKQKRKNIINFRKVEE